MLSPQNSNKMLEVEFEKVEHTGQVMDIIRSFEREIEGYQDVIFGRSEAPINSGVSTMYEISVAYYARAKEIEMYCKKFESGIDVGKTRHPLYKFRTGQLNVFIEMCKELTKLGSRRITVAQMMLAENEKDLP
jgi:hypothetical protein|tara:strand:- start:146 stop:544 length:399 start_codon:yes stop_codon:yes gene_type:complete